MELTNRDNFTATKLRYLIFLISPVLCFEWDILSLEYVHDTFDGAAIYSLVGCQETRGHLIWHLEREGVLVRAYWTLILELFHILNCLCHL
jgi:hypothetical protein